MLPSTASTIRDTNGGNQGMHDLYVKIKKAMSRRCSPCCRDERRRQPAVQPGTVRRAELSTRKRSATATVEGSSASSSASTTTTERDRPRMAATIARGSAHSFSARHRFAAPKDVSAIAGIVSDDQPWVMVGGWNRTVSLVDQAGRLVSFIRLDMVVNHLVLDSSGTLIITGNKGIIAVRCNVVARSTAGEARPTGAPSLGV